jgi:hypothetical protein
MASFDKKRFRKTGRVFCYYYIDGKQCWLKRSESKFLDFSNEFKISSFCHQLSLKFEKRNKKKIIPRIDRFLEIKANEFKDDLTDFTSLDHSTIQGKITYLKNLVIPYFISANDGGLKCNTLNQWPQKSRKLSRHLQKRGYSVSVRSSCNSAAKHFWDYLIRENYLPAETPELHLSQPSRNPLYTVNRDKVLTDKDVQLELRKKILEGNETPLNSTISSNEMLDWINFEPDLRLKLIGLFGYFSSLRPQEIFALSPSNLLAGQKVLKIEKCSIMKDFYWLESNKPLFSKMAVNVHSQLDSSNLLKPCKGKSRSQTPVTRQIPNSVLFGPIQSIILNNINHAIGLF